MARFAWLCVGVHLIGATSCSVVVGNRSTAPRPDGTLGCRTSDTPEIVDVALVALGGVLVQQGASCHGFCVGANVLVGAGLLIGVPAAASAIYGVAETVHCRRAMSENAARDREAHDSAAAKERAWQLTLEAEQAARADDCARVSELEMQIAVLDIDMRDAVFRRDVGVMRCLTAAQNSGSR